MQYAQNVIFVEACGTNISSCLPLRITTKAKTGLVLMQRPAQSQEMFHEGSVDADEISPSITIRRNRKVRSGGNFACDLVYTTELWAPINNSLVGCTEFEAWQSAKQWIIISDDSYNGLTSSMLQGCEALTTDSTDVLLVKPNRLVETLLPMDSSEHTVVVLAVDRASIEMCTKQLDVWMQTSATNESVMSNIHLLWLPTSCAEQTMPANVALEALPWCSYTVLCDMANLPLSEHAIKESQLVMLRAAVFIDAQFVYWLEGNLSAMAEADEQLLLKAIMRAAHTIFTVKRRRSDEPSIPMAFTDTAALHHTQAVSDEFPHWQVQARQLYLDVMYAQATDKLASSEVDRIKRIMEALDLLNAASDPSVVQTIDCEAGAITEPFVLLNELGTAVYSSEFSACAWKKANS